VTGASPVITGSTLGAEALALSNELSLTLRLRSPQLSAARRQAADFLVARGVDRVCIEDVLLALTEAAANAARHSGAELAEVKLALLDDHVRLSVTDRGDGFAFSGVDLSRRPDLLSPCGRGLYLISSVMDSVHVESGNGTTITMTRELRPDGCFPRGPQELGESPA
jgi:serine/threonine-protein kinase RsbW